MKRTLVVLAAVGMLVAACSSGGTPTAGGGGGTSPSAAAGGNVTADSFSNPDMSGMAGVKSVHDAGTGKVYVILPDATTSARYTAYDEPYLKKAFTAAGYADSDFVVQNAQGADQTEQSLAQAAITAGAKVLVVDPIDSATGKAIQSAAQTAGIPMISYDRATFQGDKTYYVSFNNQKVGQLIGQGVKDCITAWGVQNPKIYELDGGQDTDPNAVDFAKGYNSVLWGKADKNVPDGTTNNGMTLVKEEIAPGWDNAKGGTIFAAAFQAHPEINATVEANDGLAGAVIEDLKKAGVTPKKIPTGGQDATLQGMAYILTDWQCGSVYKPIYIEAQAAVALATYLRAGQTPPAALLNGTTTDPTNASVSEPAVLLTPKWVNKDNMEATVIKDGAITAADLCAQVTQAVCDAAGIK